MNIATETNHALELMKSQIIVQTGTEARWLERLSANSVAIMGAYAQGLQYAADRQHDSELAANWNLPS